MEEWQRKYSCNTAAETLEWIKAIVTFLQPYRFFFEAHVVNFFKDRLWESVDRDWMNCLRNELVEHLIQIPSGVVQDHWPASLKEFILTCRSLAFSRKQEKLEKISTDMCLTQLNTVLAQGMNRKKKHEVEVLAAIVSFIAKSVGAHMVVDVGAGQGYLAQVLSFQYELAVVAIDASYHHGVVTNARAERIKKYYAAKIRKSGKGRLSMPKTVTCRLLSSSMLRNLSNFYFQEVGATDLILDETCYGDYQVEEVNSSCNGVNADNAPSLVLAGLHACGDLSVTMLQAFSECKEVRAVVSIGCCYNLLSEEGSESCTSHCSFPMSNGANSIGLSLGKSARDLACQSADRWRGLEKDVAVQNFNLHAFRAVFQMENKLLFHFHYVFGQKVNCLALDLVLHRYYPEVLSTSPSIGRQGKALRRQEQRMLSVPPVEESAQNGISDSKLAMSSLHDEFPCKLSVQGECCDNLLRFEKFSKSGLSRLGLEPLEGIDLHGLWKEFEHLAELIGPYWSLRAALGPLLETLLLLDRVLFLQEHCTFDVTMLPIFDPILSPRNVAIIARKT